MMGAAALTINIHGALAETSGNFAISYGAIRAFLVFEYLRAGRKIPAASTLANTLAEGFLISTILWLISAIVPTPNRFITWTVEISTDISTTILTGRKHLQPRTNGLIYFNCPWRDNIWSCG
jgi:low temperature requirement protein LtrA